MHGGDEMKEEIKELTSEEVSQLLASGEYSGEYAPIGKYWYNENGIYVALDNSDGCCWTQDFKTKRACIKW